MKAIYPSDNRRQSFIAIGSILESSDYARLCNYILASILQLINSPFPTITSNFNRTEFGTLKCIPSDYSSINPLKFFISDSAFFYFLFLNGSIINSALDRKILKTVNTETNKL